MRRREDLSNRVVRDDVSFRMLTFPNLISTGHQAFCTRNAVQAIVEQTPAKITAFEQVQPPPGLITAEIVRE